MIRVLITGKSSYIGKSLREWLISDREPYHIDMISLREQSIDEVSFIGYDVVVHMAGIAHISSKRSMEREYYSINRDLTIKTAQRAKEDGVKQFIFLSSIIVYGENDRKHKRIQINQNTKPEPNTFYGRSKLEAEEGILALQDEEFQVAIVRSPMVYGKNSKGNYQKLSSLSKRILLFPKVSNKRSMIHINNMCELLRLMIKHRSKGIFCPQNRKFVNTTSLVQEIAINYGKHIRTTSLFNPLIWGVGYMTSIVYKVFGDLTYEPEMSACFDYQYCVVDFKESIRLTEKETRYDKKRE